LNRCCVLNTADQLLLLALSRGSPRGLLFYGHLNKFTVTVTGKLFEICHVRNSLCKLLNEAAVSAWTNKISVSEGWGLVWFKPLNQLAPCHDCQVSWQMAVTSTQVYISNGFFYAFSLSSGCMQIEPDRHTHSYKVQFSRTSHTKFFETCVIHQ
jgi:hypothetical protein